MTRTINIFKRHSEGRADIKKVERSIDGVREYVDIWGNGIIQLEKNLEAGTTSVYIHTETGSKKFKLTSTTTWFDKVVGFEPYTENSDDNFKIVHLAPNDGIYLVISKKATEVIINCD